MRPGTAQLTVDSRGAMTPCLTVGCVPSPARTVTGMTSSTRTPQDSGTTTAARGIAEFRAQVSELLALTDDAFHAVDPGTLLPLAMPLPWPASPD